MHPKFHDKKFRLLARKTQFNNQLSKHQPQTKKTCYYCENYETGPGRQNKETLEHALFSCKNDKNIPEQVLNHLNIPHLTQLPITASQIVIYDEFSTSKTLVNTKWMLLICFILNNRLNKCPNNAEEIAKKNQGNYCRYK